METWDDTMKAYVVFHPSKEGFKEYKQGPRTIFEVGFHPSKEGFKGLSPRALGVAGPACFHPSKEGFKGQDALSQLIIYASFHPSKEGFKAS